MGSSWPPLCSVISAKREGVQTAHYYTPLLEKGKKKNMKNLIGVKIQICANITVSTTLTCSIEMLDKYLN